MLELTPTYAGGDDAPELVGLAGYVEEATGEAGVVDDACLPAGDLAVGLEAGEVLRRAG